MRLSIENPRIDKVCSPDQSRPVLAQAYLRLTTTGRGKTKQVTGTIEATDSYKAIRIPVTFEDGDEPTEGFLPPAMFAKVKQAQRITLLKDRVRIWVKGESIEIERPQIQGQWPNFGQLLPNEKTDLSSFTIGINARFLYDLAQGFGQDVVALTFGKGGEVHIPDEKTGETEHYRTPNGLRPVLVSSVSGRTTAALREHGPIGLLMPVRVTVDLPWADPVPEPPAAVTTPSNGKPAKGETTKRKSRAKTRA